MGIIVYIIVFGLVLLILAPFIGGHFRNVRKDKMMIKALKDSGAAEGLTLTASDAWKGAYAIGIDTDRRRVVYLRKAGETIKEESGDLSTVKDCRVDVMARTEKTPNGSMTVIEAISLVITFNDKTLREQRLEIYNSEVFHSLGSERAIAEKWQKIISSAIQMKNRKQL
jgi:hypothetical protein